MNREEIITQIAALLSQLIESDSNAEKTKADETIEMLTIKECAEAVKGLSEHTIRQLVAQGKVKYIRTGQGKRGKILIPKTALFEYINKSA